MQNAGLKKRKDPLTRASWHVCPLLCLLMKEIRPAAKSLTWSDCLFFFFFLHAQRGCYCIIDRSSNAVLECDDGEFRGIGGYQGQCEPDAARRQRLAPWTRSPIFIYCSAWRHYVIDGTQPLRIYCDKHRKYLSASVRLSKQGWFQTSVNVLAGKQSSAPSSECSASLTEEPRAGEATLREVDAFFFCFFFQQSWMQERNWK